MSDFFNSICGLSNEATQKRLLTEQNLDLAKALGVAQAMEAAQKNALQFKDLSVGRAKGQSGCGKTGNTL